jgi:urease accessory protein
VLRIERLLPADTVGAPPVARLTLRFADRCRSRLRTTLDDGREAGLFLPRGTVVRGGDALEDGSGAAVLVVAAEEALYEVTAAEHASDPHFDLLRAAYHLGNRHVPVQLAPGRLRLERDTVLREMLLRLGLRVSEIVAPFEPEAGAYGGGHRHDHDAGGGMLGEVLSREAHAAAATPDFASMQFHAQRP